MYNRNVVRYLEGSKSYRCRLSLEYYHAMEDLIMKVRLFYTIIMSLTCVNEMIFPYFTQ